MIYHSCCMLIFFFFFAQLVVTLPPFFFSKMLPIQYILFPIYQAYFWLLLKKKEAFYVCRICFQRFPWKRIMLWILKMLKTKTKSSKIKSQVRNIAGEFFRLRSLSCTRSLVCMKNWVLPWCSMKIKYIYEKFLLFFSWRMYEKTKTKV